jgi:hypothetical protein
MLEGFEEFVESVCPETHDDIIFGQDIPKGRWNGGCKRNFKDCELSLQAQKYVSGMARSKIRNSLFVIFNLFLPLSF